MLKNCTKLHAAHAACLYFSSFNQSDHCFLGRCCRCECPCLSSQLFAFTTDNLTNFKTPQVDIFSNITAYTPSLSQNCRDYSGWGMRKKFMSLFLLQHKWPSPAHYTARTTVGSPQLFLHQAPSHPFGKRRELCLNKKGILTNIYVMYSRMSSSKFFLLNLIFVILPINFSPFPWRSSYFFSLQVVTSEIYSL